LLIGAEMYYMWGCMRKIHGRANIALGDCMTHGRTQFAPTWRNATKSAGIYRAERLWTVPYMVRIYEVGGDLAGGTEFALTLPVFGSRRWW